MQITLWEQTRNLISKDSNGIIDGSDILLTGDDSRVQLGVLLEGDD